MLCPYCNREAALVTGELVYPHRPDLARKRFWLCEPCDAYVGCHPGTCKPLGRLANASLRKAKMEAHAVFDSAWKSGKMSRNEAYKRLAFEMGIPEKECHIGMFNERQCREVQAIASEF